MANTTRGFSRRTFLLGVGGGAASVSIVWGVSELALQFLGLGEEAPTAGTLDAYAEYDGWLLTTEDKASLVEFTNGWYPRETADESSWRWTHQAATLSFPNPRTAAALHLDYDARADLFQDPPRTLTITVGDRDQVARSFAPAAGRQQINVLLPAAMVGGRDRVDVQVAVDQVFVPANVIADSQDTRELGIQVYRVAIERSPVPTR